ncbi:lactonase family protein [Mucilaginibacter limnophilus]|uniref:Lactonase family protein n=1 Tax=Mucilaginibacter limnophilus TaxID=1932778 RepID=A0A437MFP6_9SPHI|nr:lactonase family protein [Mucilaginibacter limnophilus]RVT96459.1 lactonase family protein [Mucilaginibacter limnophilus]
MLKNNSVTAPENNHSTAFYLLIGGYRSAKKGIEVYNFNADNGALDYISQSGGIENPSYLCLDSACKHVYAVSEREDGGEVHAYEFDKQTARLTLINKESVYGEAACYISIDEKQKHIFIANYKSGSISVHPIGDDRSVLPLIQQIQDYGSSADPDRQEGPHAHAVMQTPDQGFVIFTDLGTDKIRLLTYSQTETQPLSDGQDISITPGSGPRHIAFSVDNKYLYIITELTAEIFVFSYNDGNIDHIQTVSLLSEGFNGEPGGGDILLSANGLFLYATNRGDANEIAVFSVDPETGMLNFLQRCSSNGKSPRNISISPTGKHLLVANEEGNNVVVYSLDDRSGKIGDVLTNTVIEKPSCLKFVSA